MIKTICEKCGNKTGVDIEVYNNKYGATYEHSGSISFVTIDVLPELIGMEWGEVPYLYISSVSPTSLRVVTIGDGMTCDSYEGRVTVSLDHNKKIISITKSAEVCIGGDITCGADFRKHLEKIWKKDQ